MPHFENIENYEVTHPESGKKKILPIAPHSMQAVDYRPRKREQPQARIPKPKPLFADVAVEPISIRQMEKEFRQASRAEARRNPNRGIKGWIKAVRRFLASLFKRSKGGPRRQRPGRPDARKPRPDRRGPAPAGKGDNRQQGGQQGGPGTGKRRRRSRPQQQRQDGGPRKQPDSRQQGPGPGPGRGPEGPAGGQGKQGSGRSRRNRRSPRNSNPGQDSGNPKSGE